MQKRPNTLSDMPGGGYTLGSKGGIGLFAQLERAVDCAYYIKNGAGPARIAPARDKGFVRP